MRRPEDLTHRRILGTMLGDNRGKYQGCNSTPLSKYAPPPISKPVYKQDIFHTVRIHLDPISEPVNHQENGEEAQSKTWNVNKCAPLPARQPASLLTWLSPRRRDIFKQAAQSVKNKGTNMKKQGGLASLVSG